MVQGQDYRFNRLDLPFATQQDRGIVAKHAVAKIMSSDVVRLTSPIFTYKPDYLAKGQAGVAAWDSVLHGSKLCIVDPHNMFSVLENRCCHCDHDGRPKSEGFKEKGLVKTIDGAELWLVVRRWSCKGGIGNSGIPVEREREDLPEHLPNSNGH